MYQKVRMNMRAVTMNWSLVIVSYGRMMILMKIVGESLG